MGKSGGAANAGFSVDLAETKIEKVDAVFNDAKEVLQTCEDFRGGLEDAKSTMMAVSGAYTLKEGSLVDAATLFFWGVGADMGADKVKDLAPKVTMEEPYLEMPELDAACSDEAKEFMEAFKLWCNTIGASPTTATSLCEKIADIVTKCSEMAGTIAADADEAGLGAMDKVKATKAIATNNAALAKAATQMTTLQTTAVTQVADMKALIEALPGILSEASKNVTEGVEKGAKKMSEFADKQHSKENLKAEEAAKNADKVSYDRMKKDGKALPSGKKAAAAPAKEDAPAAEAAPAEEKPAEEAAPEDVKPEVRDV